MRIGRLAPDRAYYGQVRRELEGLLREPTDKQVRPCPECRIACPCCGSATCTCNCSSACPYAPGQMSSDPDKYPIEPGIVPLVYSLYTLRECRPCWSCEGHREPSGNRVRKLPRVWFYARSLVYPDLMTEYLTELRAARKLFHPWVLCVVNWGDALDTAFSIEPRPITDEGPVLDRLRRDVRSIAVDLPAEIRRLARRRVVRLEAALKATLRAFERPRTA